MHLIDALLDLCSQSNQPIIAIDGPAGAGKTTLAGNLAQALSAKYSVRTLHMDDLYNGWEGALSDELTQTLQAIITAHKDQRPLRVKTYDWHASNFREPVLLDSKDLLILEGVASGQSAVREKLSALIWIDIDEKTGLSRVLERDGQQYESLMKKWLILQSEHFQKDSTQENAEFILTNE